MSFRSWFAHLQVARTLDRLTRERRRSPRRRRASPFCFRAEALEARTLLSGYTAASASALIADINAANKAAGTNTITLAANTTFDLTAVNNTTNGANGLPVIGANKAVNLTIIGNGDTIERSTAAGTPAFRLFDVASGNSLTLENLTLQNGLAKGQGTAADGGAIFNEGTLLLSGVTVEDNTAQGATAQGADGKLKAVHSVPQPAYDAAGGGIWSNGSLTLENNTVLFNNLAEGGDGGFPVGNAYGGGLYVAGGTVNSSDSVFSDNTALADGPVTLSSVSTGYGGAIYVAGGNVSLSNDTVEYNTASVVTVTEVNAPFGGGVYVAAGTVTMRTDSVFANRSGAGGGIFIASGATVYLDSFTVINIVNNTYSNIWGTYIFLT